MDGWIKLHKKFLEWEWYDKHETKSLFIHCILKANYSEKIYRGTVVKKGSFITSLEMLSCELGLSVRKIRTALKHLKLTNELTVNSSPKGTVIQVVKWNEYQVVTNELTDNRQTSDKQLTTTKKKKKKEEEKEAFILEVVYREFDHLKMTMTEFNRLLLEYKKEDIDYKLDEVENWDKNHTKKSLNLTVRQFLRSDKNIFKRNEGPNKFNAFS
jgi:hypothetical protein